MKTKLKTLKFITFLFLFMFIGVTTANDVLAVDLDNIQFTDSTFYNGAVSATKIIELSNGNYAVGYIRSGNFYIKICQLQIDNTMSCGSEIQPFGFSGTMQSIDLFEDTTNNKIIYTVGSSSDAVYGKLNLDGSVISTRFFNSGSTNYISTVQSSSTEFAIAYQDTADSSKGKIRICKLDGSSCGTEITLTGSIKSEYNKIIKTSQNKLMIALERGDSLGILYSTNLDGSGVSQLSTFNSGAIASIDMIEASDNKLKIVFQEISDVKGKFISCELDGLSCGSKIIFSQKNSNSMIINELKNNLFITYREAAVLGAGEVINMNLDGSSISQISNFNNILTHTGSISSIIITINQLIISYADDTNSLGKIAVSETLAEGQITEQTYNQNQLSNINLNTTNYTTIISGSFNITEDNTTNYGEAIVYVQSLTDNMTISCRTNLDGTPASEITSIKLNNGEIDSIDILRNNITLDSGQHNVSLECKNEISGNTTIGATVGIGHIMRTSSGDIINYKNYQFNNTINTGASFGLVGSTTFTPNSSNENKYILVDWTAELNNTLAQNQTISIYPRIENVINNKDCEKNIQFIESNGKKTVGGVCILQVNNTIQNTISLYGTGINIDYKSRFNIKEFNYATLNESRTDILTGLNSTSSTFVEKASTTFTTDITNAEVIVKGSLSATSTTSDILFGRITVENELGTIIYTTKDIAMSTTSNVRDITFQVIIPIPSGTNTFRLYLRSQTGGLIEIDSGEINGYVTQKLDIVDNSFLIRAFEFWDNSPLSNFSAVIGDTTFSTTGNNITVFGESTYQDILINKENYLSRLFEQHDTTQDLNASIGQHRLDIRGSEKYTNFNIDNFTVETDIGNFSTTNGLVTLYPFTGIYNNWNITTDIYYNKSGLQFQVGGSLTEYTVQNFTDTILNFKDSFTSIDIYPTCNYNGFTINSPYELIANSFVNTFINCSLTGYNYFTTTLNKTGLPTNETLEMNKTTLTMRMYDQQNLGQLTFDVTIENSTDSIIFTNQLNFSKNYNEIPTGAITMYVDGKNGSTTYSEARFYNTLTPYTNIEIIGYLTKTDISTPIIFQVNEKGFATGGIGDVSIEIQSRINGSYMTIIESKTDADGRAFVELDPTKSYKAIFKKDNYVTASAELIPGVTEYTVEMALVSEQFTYIEEISYQILPSEAVLNINNSYDFIGFISTQSLTLTEFKIYNQIGAILYSDSSTNPTGTQFNSTIFIDDSIEKIKIEMKYYKNGEIKTLEKNYKVINTIGFIKSAQEFANDNSFLNKFIRFFVSMILIASALAVSKYSELKEVSLLVIPAFAFLGYIEFITWLQVTVFTIITLTIYMGGKN